MQVSIDGPVSADRLLIPSELMRDYRNLGSYEQMTNEWESVITRQLTGLCGPEKVSTNCRLLSPIISRTINLKHRRVNTNPHPYGNLTYTHQMEYFTR